MKSRAEQILLVALSVYSVSILISQATMSIGIPVVLLPAVFAMGGPRAFLRKLRLAMADSSVRAYLRLTHFVAIACLLSLIGAYFFPVRIDAAMPRVEWVKDLWKVWYLYWPIVLVACLNELASESRRTLMRVFFVAFGVVAAVGCLQFFTGWPRPTLLPGQSRFYHANGFFGHHLSFASIMIFPFFLVLDDALDSKILGRTFSVVIGSLGLVALIATHSRQVWLSVLVGLVLFFVLRLRPRQWVPAALAVAALIALALQLPTLKSRAINLAELHDRIELWKANFAFFKMRPLTGVGWHHNLELTGAYFRAERPWIERPFVGHAHSNFFEFLGGMGIVGVLAYLAWTYGTLRMAYRATVGFFVGWLVFHLNGLTQVNFWESKVLHSSMWSLSLILTLRKSRKP